MEERPWSSCGFIGPIKLISPVAPTLSLPFLSLRVSPLFTSPLSLFSSYVPLTHTTPSPSLPTSDSPTGSLDCSRLHHRPPKPCPQQSLPRRDCIQAPRKILCQLFKSWQGQTPLIVAGSEVLQRQAATPLVHQEEFGGAQLKLGITLKRYD